MINFWDNFKTLCDLRGIAPSALCLQLDLGNSTATAWKQGRLPGADALVKIADEFNCSVDYLLGRTESITLDAPELTPLELELLQSFRVCSELDKGRILGKAEECAENFQKGAG